MTVRPAAVAGLFYPGDGKTLQQLVQRLLTDNPQPAPQAMPKALIVPHAGLVYSGPVAARAYNSLRPFAADIRRVLLLGPSHRLAFRGIAMPAADSFATPLGQVTLDTTAIKQLADQQLAGYLDQAHALEHSLEVQLPFLQTLLPNARLLPLVVGDASWQQVAAVLELFADDPHTLIIISSDLSHYHAYDEAVAIDRATIQSIEQRRPGLHGEQACGCRALNGLLALAEQRGWQLQLVDYRNSGDTAGDHSRVVGYAAFIAA